MKSKARVAIDVRVSVCEEGGVCVCVCVCALNARVCYVAWLTHAIVCLLRLLSVAIDKYATCL